MKSFLLLALLFLNSFANAQWQNLNCPSSSGISVAANGNYVFVGTAGDAVYLSNDLGNTWTQCASSGLSSTYVWDMGVDDTLIFASTMMGINLSADDGVNWSY